MSERRIMNSSGIKWSQFMGFYLLCVAAFQIYVSIEMASGQELFFYLDPRIGIFAFSQQILEKYDLVLMEWLTAGWLIVLAILFLMGKAPIKTYVVSELLLATPSVFFFVIVMVTTSAKSHGFGIVELICPIVIMIATTVIPLVVILRHSREA